jgi:hypothetical protein
MFHRKVGMYVPTRRHIPEDQRRQLFLSCQVCWRCSGITVLYSRSVTRSDSESLSVRVRILKKLNDEKNKVQEDEGEE